MSVLDYLEENGESSITSVADGVGRDRHVVSKQLHLLRERGLVDKREHGPSTLWKPTSSALLTRLDRDDKLSKEIKEVFDELPATVSVHDDTGSIRWSSDDGDGHPRKCHLFHRGRLQQCAGCPIDTVRETGTTKSFTTSWQDDEKHITLIPITDSENNTAGVIEHIA